MIPEWLNEVVGDFGRQLGLSAFALGERGTAGVRFENGLTLRLEYANGCLVLMVGFVPPTDAPAQTFFCRLLAASHYAADGAQGVRTGYLSRTGEAIVTRSLPERTVDVPRLGEAFQQLFQTAMEMGGRA